jgi:alkylated DNA repair dioxygenase AlkB/ubiquinone/menaquinone biosynthesis C-methylase UbiE
MDEITTKENARFRSVLSHEQLPKDELGFIHLAGAYEPKKKRSDIAKENNDETANIPKEQYWTNDTLQQALLNILGERHEYLNLPHAVQSVTVLDLDHTKVRLGYASPKAALEVLLVWRQQKLEPSHLFQDTDGDDAHVYIFGSRAFQASLTTTAILPPNSWTRSNPPKFRRLLTRAPDEDQDPSILEKERSETRFIFMTGLLDTNEPLSPDSFWNHTHNVVQSIGQAVNQYDTSGLGAEVFVSHKKLTHSCHVGMRSAADAKALIHALQGKSCEWKWSSSHFNNGDLVATATLSSGTLFLDYAAVTQKSMAKSKARANGEEDPVRGEPSRPECTSITEHVVVPGLQVIPDYLTEAQEQVLMAVLTGPQAPWAPTQTNVSKSGSVKRLVQHYGYVFDYETADVLRDRNKSGAECPPMPAVLPDEEKANDDDRERVAEEYAQDGQGWEVLACLIDKSRKYEFSPDDTNMSFPGLNQLTVNHYKPGEGIGSHVDTLPAFADGLMSISLNGGIVMEFRKVNSDLKKLVYLPPRSLVLMSGPARFEWEHMIVTRRTDTHNGVVLPRSLRVSLTLRTALKLNGKNLPLVASSRFPPTWGGEIEQNSSRPALATPATERDHVHAVYDAIATQWHHTRGKRGVIWPVATQFIQRLPIGSVVADVGCGDGKYFPVVWEAGSYVIGTDISLPLLQTCMSSQRNEGTTPESRHVSEHRTQLRDRPAVAVADCMSVPLRSKSCDAAICIAVMHHLSTEERRIRCMEELTRIVRVGGTINIQAWAMEQQQNSRRRFAAPDVFVPFNAQPKYLDKGSAEAKADGSPVADVEGAVEESKSVAQEYSEIYKNADYDEKKGLVVFQRYCHMYKKGELEELVGRVPGVSLVESGYESGNHFVILEVID